MKKRTPIGRIDLSAAAAFAADRVPGAQEATVSVEWHEEPGEASVIRTERVAVAMRELGRKLGAHYVVVFVGDEDGSHHVSWSGGPLAIRGLIEAGYDIIRQKFTAVKS